MKFEIVLKLKLIFKFLRKTSKYKSQFLYTILASFFYQLILFIKKFFASKEALNNFETVNKVIFLMLKKSLGFSRKFFIKF